MKEIINKLLLEINSHGSRAAVVPFSRINDIKKDLFDLKNSANNINWANRMINHVTDDKNKFLPPDLDFEPQSLISVMMPSSKVLLQFNYFGKSLNCTIPPIYADWNLKNNQMLQCISENLSLNGFKVKKIEDITQKLLAVHCGMGQYGRNNICYNKEFGSYIQIMTYISDLPCDIDEWFPVSRMEICDNCFACITSCPTNIIDKKNKLINSDRCITNLNESPEEFPGWLDASVHNCIIGCMKCQDCCPANSHNKDNMKIGTTFTEEETNEIVNHKDNDVYSNSLAEKINNLGILPEYIKVLQRNLSVLLRENQ